MTRVSRLRSLVKELHPDVVVAFMTEANVVALWACWGWGVPVIISERNQPDRPGLGRLHKLARRVSYPSARALVVQTEEIAGWARDTFAFPSTSFPTRFNCAPERPHRNESDVRFLVSLGRLAPQKGFDILIRSFASSGKPASRLASRYLRGGARPDLSWNACESRVDMRRGSRFQVSPKTASRRCGKQASSSCRRASKAILMSFSKRSPRFTCRRHGLPWRHRRDPERRPARDARDTR